VTAAEAFDLLSLPVRRLIVWVQRIAFDTVPASITSDALVTGSPEAGNIGLLFCAQLLTAPETPLDQQTKP
jgi:hypothetical protein